ncbi:MAG: hypothetical protein WC815_17770 [Vicinamibacterales bacterium]|jgi:hypothetical protein
MTASLDRFLRTGQLGPLTLGMKPSEAQTLLGEPSVQSQKLNPLLLGYGPLELTFVGKKRQSPQLVQIKLSFSSSAEGLPDAVDVDQWILNANSTIRDFNHLLDRSGIEPAVTYPGHEIHLHSGVKAIFYLDRLKELSVSRRDTDRNTPPTLSDSREPSLRHIQDLLLEAETAVNAGLTSAGFVLAWAALEAAMRRTALSAGLESQIGVQPSALMRALYGVGRLNSEDIALVEGARQARTVIVHGLAPTPIDSTLVGAIVKVAQRLLRSSDAA